MFSLTSDSGHETQNHTIKKYIGKNIHDNVQYFDEFRKRTYRLLFQVSLFLDFCENITIDESEFRTWKGMIFFFFLT